MSFFIYVTIITKSGSVLFLVITIIVIFNVIFDKSFFCHLMVSMIFIMIL